MTKAELLKALQNIGANELVYVITRGQPFGYSIIDSVKGKP